MIKLVAITLMHVHTLSRSGVRIRCVSRAATGQRLQVKVAGSNPAVGKPGRGESTGSGVSSLDGLAEGPPAFQSQPRKTEKG